MNLTSNPLSLMERFDPAYHLGNGSQLNSSQPRILYEYAITSFISAIVLIAISIVGFIGNSLSFYVFTRPRMKISSINFLLSGLAVFDTLMALLGGPVFSVLGICMPFEHSKLCHDVTSYLTVIVYPLAMASQTGSIWVLMLITFERFVAVCFPLHARSICTLERAKATLAVVCVSAAAYNLVRFREYQIISISQLSENFSTFEAPGSVYLEPILRNDVYYAKVYIFWLNFLTHLLIPMISLIIMNGFIIYCLKMKSFNVMQKRMRRMSSTPSIEPNVTWMMTCITCLFICCNSLAFVLNLLEGTDCLSNINDKLFFMFADINNLLIQFNSSVNCFIYYRFSRRYRKELDRIFARKPHRSNVTTELLYAGNEISGTRRFSKSQHHTIDPELSCPNTLDAPLRMKRHSVVRIPERMCLP